MTIAPEHAAEERAPDGMPTVAEFFAGIGLVRLGLEQAGFRVVWANDIDADKHEMYTRHFQDDPDRHTYVTDSVADVKGVDMPDNLGLAWASFPCTDLSLAGWRRGLAGKESGTFMEFVRVLEEMKERRPRTVALENVVGLATSHKGADLVAAVEALNDLDYSVDVLTLDARRFVPQSRPRLFIVGTMDPPPSVGVPNRTLRPVWLDAIFSTDDLRMHQADLPDPPALKKAGLSEIVEKLSAEDAQWWDEARSAAFLNSLSPIQDQRLQLMRAAKTISYRTAYRRTRNGVPMWEIRADDVAGCLRTARGGSSKQALVEAGHGRVRVRWMTAREYARLMGADDYRLDGLRRNQALYGFGDAVCVNAVQWLAEHYLAPLVAGKFTETPAVAV
ncbi:DNA cytosine methyltransferase [Nonomuraea indica]|uniref:DNA cytosine methyltransferase n=1 Tax=Nonomuraea indica TaxID=1581193 RepID=UPI001FE7B99F|nr:DNA cytosine methyltransferase [Nonomuraea indica]